MTKYIIALLVLTILVTVSTIPAFPSNSGEKPGYQCRNIGKQKVKPFKARTKYKIYVP